MNHPDLTSQGTPCGYTGQGSALNRIILRNNILGFVTLQVYALWGIVHLRRHIWSHIRIGGDPLTWTGTHKSQRSCSTGLTALMAAMFVAFNMASLASLLHIFGAFPPSRFWHIPSVLMLFLASFGDYLSCRYQLRHTVWRGAHFELGGHAGVYFVIYTWGWIVALLTLGIGYGYLAVTTRRYLALHTSWGNVRARYTGTEKEVRWLYMLGGIASIMSLGAYLPWHIAKLRKYHGERVMLGSMRLEVSQEGYGLSNLWLINALICLGSLGLGIGYARARSMAYQLQHLHVINVPPKALAHTAILPQKDEAQNKPGDDGAVDALLPNPYPFWGA